MQGRRVGGVRDREAGVLGGRGCRRVGGPEGFEGRMVGGPEGRRDGGPERRRAGEPEGRRAGLPEGREPGGRRFGRPESRKAGEPEGRRGPEQRHRAVPQCEPLRGWWVMT